MIGFWISISQACTLITLNYIALKLRKHVEAYEQAVVPLLTGIASIVMMLQPLPTGSMLADFRFVPVVMAGLRYGIGTSLLSTIPPMAYMMLTHQSDPWPGFAQGLLIPAIVSALFHKIEYRASYARLRIRDGLYVSALLFLLRLTGDSYFLAPLRLHEQLPAAVFLLLVSSGAIVMLIAMFNDESRNWLIQRQLEMQAKQDSLTRLPNLRSFMDIAHSTLTLRQIAILMVDIDNFKQYNDRYGHLEGDRLLQEIGYMLRNLIGEKDYVARYGGEEFIVMCHTSETRQLTGLAERLCGGIAEHPFHGHPLPEYGGISVSIGISVGSKVNDDLLKLISEADEALYASKNSGKNRFTFYGQLGNAAGREAGIG